MTRIEGELPKQTPDLTAALDGLNTAIGKTDTALANIDGKLPPDLGKAIDGINTAVGDANTALANIDGKLPPDLGKAIDGLNTAVANANTALIRIEGELPAQTPDLTAAIDALSTAVGKANDALSRIETATAGAATADAVSGLQTQLAGIGKSLADVAAKIDTQASSPTIDTTLNNTLSELKQTLSRVETAVMKAPAAGSGFEAVMSVHYADPASIDDQGAVDLVVIPEVAQVLGDHKSCSIEVDGHADTVGSDTANYALADKRAAAVADKLKAKFADVPVVQKAYGERRLFDLTGDQINNLMNRRVEVVVRCAA